METVTIQKLSKTYPSGKEALKQLSLTLSTGEVFGFLGPNGAGKTTTVKLLTGVLSPSGGSCEIMGVNPNIQPEKVHLLAGIVTEHAQMYDNLTGIENLMFYAAAFGMEQKGKWRAESLLKELELTEAKDQKLATYSTGIDRGYLWQGHCYTTRKFCFLTNQLLAWIRKVRRMSIK